MKTELVEVIRGFTLKNMCIELNIFIRIIVSGSMIVMILHSLLS